MDLRKLRNFSWIFSKELTYNKLEVKTVDGREPCLRHSKISIKTFRSVSHNTVVYYLFPYDGRKQGRFLFSLPLAHPRVRS